MLDDPPVVQWRGRWAIVSSPDHVSVANVGLLREQLLSVINRGATVLIVDMSGTASCDHSAVDALARAYQRAAASRTQLRLVVTAPMVRRVISIEGLDRLVSVYPSLEAATAAGVPEGGVLAHLTDRPRPDGQGSASLTAVRGTTGLTTVPGPAVLTPAVLWQLIDALGDGLALADDGGAIVLVNRRCSEMFGYLREELIGQPVDVLVPVDLRAAHRTQRAAYGQAPRTRPMGARARLAGLRKDGTSVPVEISLSPVPTATGRYVLAVIRDAVEARRRADLADLARGAIADQSHRVRELLDQVAHQLFQVGLSLQATEELPGEVAQQRIAQALDRLDVTIHEIRDYAFDSPDDGLLPRA
jgi:anti-anti-sigma factor